MQNSEGKICIFNVNGPCKEGGITLNRQKPPIPNPLRLICAWPTYLQAGMRWAKMSCSAWAVGLIQQL